MLTRSRAKLINNKRKKSDRFNNYVSSLENKYGNRFSGWAPSSKNISIESISVNKIAQERSGGIGSLSSGTINFTVVVRGTGVITNWFFVNTIDNSQIIPDLVTKTGNTYILTLSTSYTATSPFLLSPYTIVYKERAQPRVTAGLSKNYFPWGNTTFPLQLPNNGTFTSFNSSVATNWAAYKSITPIPFTATSSKFFRFNIKQTPDKPLPEIAVFYVGFSQDLNKNGSYFSSVGYPTLSNTGISGATVEIASGDITNDTNTTLNWTNSGVWGTAIGNSLNSTTGLNFIIGIVNKKMVWGFDINTVYAMNFGRSVTTDFEAATTAYLTILVRTNTASPATDYVYTITQY
jgi:hypothetical protein